MIYGDDSLHFRTFVLILVFMNNRRVPEPFTYIPPTNGVTFQSGGMMSPWYAYVVDFDHLMLSRYEGTEKTLLSKSSIKRDETSQIIQLVKQAIAENKGNFPPNPDVDFKLDLSLDGTISSTETYGPIEEGWALEKLLLIFNRLLLK